MFLRDLKKQKNWNMQAQEMQAQLGQLKEQCAQLQKENEAAEAEAGQLKEQCAQLQKENEAAEADRQRLQAEAGQLKEQCAQLKKDNERVYAGHAGLEEEINFLKFRISTLDELHESVVSGSWPHDGSFKDYTCRSPFERVDILPRGEVYTCCSAYIKHNYYIGNIFEHDFEEIWNSEKARRLRHSVQEGNFEYCQKYCKFLHMASEYAGAQGPHDNPVRLKEIENGSGRKQDCSWSDYAVKKSPRYITLSCDESCSLHCPTCRSRIKILGKEESGRLYERLMQAVRPMLSDCEMLTALGSGDLFASSAVSRFVQTVSAQEFPKLHMTIVTNLQLADERKWKEFSNLSGIPKSIRVSIDAASKKTYEENRCGGGWERLQENLECLRGMKKNPNAHVEQTGFNFVVQKNNYREIEAFMEMAERMEADVVEFQKLANWGTFSEREYLERDVLNRENPEYESAVSILKKALSRRSGGIAIVQNIFE